MTKWVKGQSGNPGGSFKGPRPEREFAKAIRAACNQICPKKRRLKLQLIAETVVTQAIAGESWAVEQVANRLDGKPREETHITYEKHDAADWSRDELVAIINECRKGGAIAAPQDGRGGGSDPVH